MAFDTSITAATAAQYSLTPAVEPATRLQAGTADFRRTARAMFVGGFATFALLYGMQPLMPMFSVEFDTTLLKEVVINLIENAIKYTPSGGQIEVISHESEEFVHVLVKDTGEGIKPEDMEKVWGKFTRGSDQDLRTKGTGLGLYLVKYFIELHGGKVTMESKLGLGTTVAFTLPLDAEEDEVLV